MRIIGEFQVLQILYGERIVKGKSFSTDNSRDTILVGWAIDDIDNGKDKGVALNYIYEEELTRLGDGLATRMKKR